MGGDLYQNHIDRKSRVNVSQVLVSMKSFFSRQCRQSGVLMSTLGEKLCYDDRIRVEASHDSNVITID